VIIFSKNIKLKILWAEPFCSPGTPGGKARFFAFYLSWRTFKLSF
jgi:hypothetical protein